MATRDPAIDVHVSWTEALDRARRHAAVATDTAGPLPAGFSARYDDGAQLLAVILLGLARQNDVAIADMPISEAVIQLADHGLWQWCEVMIGPTSAAPALTALRPDISAVLGYDQWEPTGRIRAEATQVAVQQLMIDLGGFRISDQVRVLFRISALEDVREIREGVITGASVLPAPADSDPSGGPLVFPSIGPATLAGLCPPDPHEIVLANPDDPRALPTAARSLLLHLSLHTPQSDRSSWARQEIRADAAALTKLHVGVLRDLLAAIADSDDDTLWPAIADATAQLRRLASVAEVRRRRTGPPGGGR